MGQVIPFVRAVAANSGAWTEAERQELARLTADFVRNGRLGYEVNDGQADDGQPWFAISVAATGDTVVHVARIGGRFVYYGVAENIEEEASDLAALVSRATRNGPINTGGPSNAFAPAMYLLTIAVSGQMQSASAAPIRLKGEANGVVEARACPTATEIAQFPQSIESPMLDFAYVTKNGSPAFADSLVVMLKLAVGGPMAVDGASISTSMAMLDGMLIRGLAEALLDGMQLMLASASVARLEAGSSNIASMRRVGSSHDRPDDRMGDLIVGGAEHDYFAGGSGSDDIWGGDGNDTLRGGEDDDRIDGGADDDLLFGEAGDDTLFGGQGRDDLNAGEGNDLLQGEWSSVNENMVGIELNIVDWVAFVAATDDNRCVHVVSDSSDAQDVDASELQLTEPDRASVSSNPLVVNRIHGGLSMDVIVGRTQVHILAGGKGDDRLFSQEKRLYTEPDTLRGGEGDDTLIGGAGDELHGGAGADLFVLSPLAFGAQATQVYGFSRRDGDRIGLREGHLQADMDVEANEIRLDIDRDSHIDAVVYLGNIDEWMMP